MTDRDGDPATGSGLAPVERIGLAALPLVALAAVMPFGWDRSGPIRWLALPAIGFALLAAATDRVGSAGRPVARTGGDGPTGGAQPRLAGLAIVAWAGLLAWGLVATVLAVDPLHAWIGTPDRRFGWLTWLLCGALFVVGLERGATARPLVVRATAVGAALLGLHTIGQWFDVFDDGGFAGGRLGGPLAQPAYLGAAAALATPIAAGLALDRGTDPGWRVAGAVGATSGGAALLLSQSRAAWLGSIVAVALVALAAVRDRGRGPAADDPDRLDRLHRLAVAAAVGVPVALVAAVPALRRRVTGAADSGGVIDGRLDEWRVGLRALGDAPLTGHGPEGYRTVFGANVDEAYVVQWGRDVLTDRAHNGLLDIGLAFGAPGLVLAAAALGVVVVGAVRTALVGDPTIVGLAVGVVAYAVGQQFLFPLSELDPLFWLLAGLVVASAASPGRNRTAERRRPATGIGPLPPTARTAVTGVAVGLAVLTAVAGLADLVGDAEVAGAIDGRRTDTTVGSIAETDPGAPAEELDRATALRPDSIRYRFIASRLASGRGDLDAALREVRAGLARSAADPALRGEEAALLLTLARGETDPAAREPAIDRAIEVLDRLVADDPLHPRHLQRLGVALALAGRFDEGEVHLLLAVELAPDDPEARTNLEILRTLADEQGREPDDEGVGG
ncbi:MAG: O-antigen ligase family protein [Actinomycetota bacterium]